MCDWYKTNNETMSESQTITYNDAVNKLMRTEFEKESAFVSKVRVYLYNKIKTNISRDAFEREFE